MRFVRCLLVLSLAACAHGKDKKQKHFRSPSQPGIMVGCVYVGEIYSNPRGWRYGAGITGVVDNDCDKTVQLLISIAYHDKSGVQFGDGSVTATVGAHSKYEFNKYPYSEEEQQRFGAAKVVDVRYY